jgi:hypothetical protein
MKTKKKNCATFDGAREGGGQRKGKYYVLIFLQFEEPS